MTMLKGKKESASFKKKKKELNDPSLKLVQRVLIQERSGPLKNQSAQMKDISTLRPMMENLYSAMNNLKTRKKLSKKNKKDILP